MEPLSGHKFSFLNEIKKIIFVKLDLPTEKFKTTPLPSVLTLVPTILFLLKNIEYFLLLACFLSCSHSENSSGLCGRVGSLKNNVCVSQIICCVLFRTFFIRFVETVTRTVFGEYSLDEPGRF